ncbi:MAG: hypothetical protein ABIJ56_22655 [Pseudomonadota bacterium]
MSFSILHLLDQVFTVETIMTPRNELSTLNNARRITIKKEDEYLLRYDLIPLTEDGRIVEIYHTKTNKKESITEKWLITRDTSIPELMNLFVESSQQGFIVLQRQDVVGLVTVADLNKLPTLVYLYNLFAEFEVSLEILIRSTFRNNMEKILSFLRKARKDDVIERYNEQVINNIEIDYLHLLYLLDIIDVVIGHDELRNKLGFPSKTKAEKALGGITRFRNRIMHPAQPLLVKIPEDLSKVLKHVATIKNVINQINSLS